MLLLILLLLFTLFLLFIEFDLASAEAGTGSLLVDCAFVFLLTLESDRVTGWLFANEVSILLIVFSSDKCEFPFCSIKTVGSKEASGVVRGELEPVVDIGEAGGGIAGSRKGFFVFVGEDEKGLDLPIVANFWLEPNGFSPFVLALEDETVDAIGMEDVLMKLLTKGLVELIVVAGCKLGGGEVSPKRVSFWTPAMPFWEK